MTRKLHDTTKVSPPPGLPRPGEVLQGKYRIERELGSGGFGVVFEVSHLVMTQRHFAIKWLLPPEGNSDAARRFVREAQIAGRIRHPHVVDVYDIYLEEDGCFLVMELLEGESLGARLRRDARLAPAEACLIFQQCLSGVGAAHAAGVIHRDLKPDNIFLVRTETGAVHPKVLDFGISRVTAAPGAATTETRKGTIIGTPAYMAPEQLRAAAVDGRTDIYALGVTLYEALMGRPAYVAETYADMVVKIVTGEAGAWDSNLPPSLVKIVMRAMHRDPERRYQTAPEFAAALREHAEAQSARPFSSLTRTARRRVALAGAAVTLLLALGIAVATSRQRAPNAPAAASSDEPHVVVPAAASSDEPARVVVPAAASSDEPAHVVVPASPPAQNTAAVAPPRPSPKSQKRKPASPAPAAPSEPAPLTQPTPTPILKKAVEPKPRIVLDEF